MTPENEGMTLHEWFALQRRLQVESYLHDPTAMVEDARADSAMANVLSATDELHEALQEVKWKPWLTTGRGDWVDRDAFVQELVDVMFFLANLFLLADATGEEVTARYFAKLDVNAQRQRDGYTGEKDADGRALDEPTLQDMVARQIELERHERQLAEPLNSDYLTPNVEAPTPMSPDECSVCHKRSNRVRPCCFHPDAVASCDNCYTSGKDGHGAHLDRRVVSGTA